MVSRASSCCRDDRACVALELVFHKEERLYWIPTPTLTALVTVNRFGTWAAIYPPVSATDGNFSASIDFMPSSADFLRKENAFRSFLFFNASSSHSVNGRLS